MKISSFRTVVTPPFGHPLCGGWIAPVSHITDPLFAQGIILQDDGQEPVVLCAVDWCEIRAEDHVLWRERIAEAVGTEPDRVAVQCVHQHNAPLTDVAAQRLTSPHGLPEFVDEEWLRSCADQAALFAQDALSRARQVTHVACGEAKVAEVAANRRVHKIERKVQRMRGSSCKDAELRAMEEGLIDPMLKTISFWEDNEKLAAMHYYATHPMSYYGDGCVSADFAGLARERVISEQEVAHLYFTGCGGNIGAGKYNDGSKPVRPELSERIYQGICEAERNSEKVEADGFQWQTEPVALPPGPQLNEQELLEEIADPQRPQSRRKHAAMALVYVQWIQAGKTIPFTGLRLGDKIRIVHLPGEPFVQYQLYAQEENPDLFIAVAGYGDGIPGYIPLAVSFEEGGYEPTASYVAPESEDVMKRVISDLVK
ncbi:MAG: hypothetical protein QF886_10025 [Planctomycetota bacterium]|nr:hypothetical protein [Planctomycetota bacterium]